MKVGAHLFQKLHVLQGWLRPAATPVSSPSQDEEAQLSDSSSNHIDVSSMRTSQDRLVSSVVLQEAGLGWEETTQLLQGQISRFVSRDDSDLSGGELTRQVQLPSGSLSRSASL